MSTSDPAISEAAARMTAFAERTGIGTPRPRPRYLWTDAFAVCNFFTLEALTRNARFGELARALIGDVHRVLAAPAGGLRIGKPLPERAPGEPFDEALEWDRDGQYFHYLTRWMHALDQAARHTGEASFNEAARALAETAHRAFVTRGSGGGLRMIWKLSVDLSRPLVDAMGQHDPVDGLVTALALEDTAGGFAAPPRLDHVISEYATMTDRLGMETADPLGLGGLLSDAARLAQLPPRPGLDRDALVRRLLAAAAQGLGVYAHSGAWRQPPAHRLAFRELGLAIGLAGLGLVADLAPAHARALGAFAPLGTALVTQWRGAAWVDHRDINEVMLATSLLPDGGLRRLSFGAASACRARLSGTSGTGA